MIELRKRHTFRWTLELVSVELFKVKNILKHKSFTKVIEKVRNGKSWNLKSLKEHEP